MSTTLRKIKKTMTKKIKNILINVWFKKYLTKYVKLILQFFSLNFLIAI